MSLDEKRSLTAAASRAQALSVALADFPLLNSSLRGDGEALVQHAAHNIGVAMATPSGLVARPSRHAAARTGGNPTSACTVKES